jgi:hypothetical protein
MAETIIKWALAILLGLSAAGTIVILILLGIAGWQMNRGWRGRR